MAIVKVNSVSGNPYRDSENGQFASKDGQGSLSSSQVDDGAQQNKKKGGYTPDFSNRYFINVEIEERDVDDYINSNQYLKTKYDASDDNTKKAVREKLKKKLSKESYEEYIKEGFRNSNMQDFKEFRDKMDASIPATLTSSRTGKTYTKAEMVNAAHSMCGSPWSFVYQTYCRIGKDAMKKLDRYKDYSDSQFAKMEDWKDKMHALTSFCKSDKDIRVYRLLNTDYLVSQFDEILPPMNRYQYFAYQKLKGSNGQPNLSEDEIKQLADTFKQCIGMNVASDNGFSSFGMDEASSHMARHLDPDTQRQVQILYDCPKGTNMYVTNYQYETEGYFGDNVSYYIKDAYPVKRQVSRGASTGTVDTLVLVYGVK